MIFSTMQVWVCRRKRIVRAAVFSLLGGWLLLVGEGRVYARGNASLQGFVKDADGRPVVGARILVASQEHGIRINLTGSTEGFFSLLALPPGIYQIIFDADGFKSHRTPPFTLDPGQTSTLMVTLTPEGHPEASSSTLLRMDYRDCTYQTVLGPEHIHGLPSAHNVWSLIENQDLSATVNRIDVGGLWGTIPALFSARGGTSWTQSVYLLNGFDVSDPFQTGLPLLIPDFYSLRFTQMENASPSPEALSPGGQFNMITKDGSDTFHGGVSVFTIHSKLQSSNISEALRREGLQESHAFNHALDGNVQISGPLIPGKLTFFSSLTGYHVSRNIADYLEDDLSSLFSGLFSLKLRTEDSTLRVLWTGQTVSHPSFGAGRSVPYEATSQRKETYNVFQSIWEKRLRQRLHLTAGITVAQGATRTDFQSSSGPQHGKDVFSRIPAGAAPLAGKSLRTLWSVLMKGEGLWTPFPRTRHSLAFGVRLQGASSSASERVKKSLHRHFLDGVP
ncbi:MAG: carboxypeptidase regulatory-like domain-containing protein, partial [Candidatus Aminicenantales bacterium]